MLCFTLGASCNPKLNEKGRPESRRKWQYGGADTQKLTPVHSGSAALALYPRSGI